ncbi:hypothetical protein H6F98_00730 [Microcoleus sp. FACHB-SPT15]|jgi:hypothetical protein|uniref:hypothetical protein n=1 Tax=Microcoleus sp. FACHB-SPT15 TaxID=2692830 RepID=UPI0019CA5E75|nr:hypothetical protein [Microcoleus sp. FACHB-SPT15]MBD1804001.1 hypothetical protein [Microcoleus sp. FACHB-SPT15]
MGLDTLQEKPRFALSVQRLVIAFGVTAKVLLSTRRQISRSAYDHWSRKARDGSGKLSGHYCAKPMCCASSSSFLSKFQRCSGREFDNNLYKMLKSGYVLSVTRRLG